MANGRPSLAEVLVSRITDEMVEEAAGFREDPLPLGGITRSETESTQLPANRREVISQLAYDFVVRWETGSKAYYERVIKGRPIWPGYASGITIGCGYDLGYHALADFRTQWATRLAPADFGRLARTIGFKTVEPDRATKVQKATALVGSFADIVVPWSTAIEQFDNAKLPDLVGQLYRALDNLDRLHPHCRGALLSLVFNRGTPFTTAGDRYIEMRAIGTLMRDGSATSFRKIPVQLRSMKRIWGESSSLAKRREQEAELFEAGLAEMEMLENVAAGVGELEGVAAAPLQEMHAAVEAVMTDDADEAESEAALRDIGVLEATGLSPSQVRWNPKDDEQPDYRHLDTRFGGATFELMPEDLDALIKANVFQPIAGKIVVALRGARLVGGPKRENVSSITVTDQRPDHREFRCIIGAYDPQARKLWAYQASTVPNIAYVYKCHADFKAGISIGNLTGNILPTGCYTYTVGTHRRGKPGEIPTVLRLSTTADGASTVVVLRSLQDVMYDRFDAFPVATPADNVHPGQLSQGFSSAGCLTLPGRFSGGQHTGAWADFRRALGVDGNSNGKQFSLVLLTGLDAAIAAAVRQAQGDAGTLFRLRHGSKGPVVAKLQAALGLTPDASQLIGPTTRGALIKRQAAILGWADGIYSAAMDELLGLKVLETS